MENKKIKEQYKHQISYFGDEFSKVKDYYLEPWQETYVERMKSYLLDKNYKNKTLIDIGTGLGYIAIEAAKLGLNVIACDLTAEALDNIERYKKKFNLSNIKLIECRAEKIPLRNQSVDYIVSNAVLEHIPEEEKAIKEWKRILKKNGKMMITVPIKYKFLLPLLVPIAFLYDKRIGHLRRYDLIELKEKFRMRILKYIYSGHLKKFFGVLISEVLRTKRLAKIIEEIESKEEKKRYGATNIVVFFKK